MHHFIRLGVALFVIAMPTPALAQEQENPSTPGQIPDPSTYQGSTVLQQQSDSQDQYYRQQQQQQSQGYQQQYAPMGGQGGYSGGGRSSGYDAGQCLDMLERSASLAPLRGLVELGTNKRDPRYYTIDRRPTAAERPVLIRWLAARRRCGITQFSTASLSRANAIVTQRLWEMIGSLSRGLMTYGDFNYKRALNTESFLRYQNSQ